MGFTTSYWREERWSRRAADTLISYGRCWNPSLGNWDVNWRVGVEKWGVEKWGGKSGTDRVTPNARYGGYSVCPAFPWRAGIDTACCRVNSIRVSDGTF